MKMLEIFPISLPRYARRLCERYCWTEFQKRTSFQPNCTNYEFMASLQENGDVKLSAYFDYNSPARSSVSTCPGSPGPHLEEPWNQNMDDGFCQSSGSIVLATIQPFNEQELAEIIEAEKFRLAKIEYSKRKDEALILAIKQIQDEMFGPIDPPIDNC
jgi:hypothetical protein